jgi:hypothetical protein
MATDTKNSGGIGFLGLLTITFIVLKLTKVISWSWWWVLSPSLIPVGILLSIVVAALVAAAMAGSQVKLRVKAA